MKRSLPLAFLLFLLTAVSNSNTSQAAPVEHTFHLMLTHSSGASLAISPSITALEVTSPTLAAGGPLYQGQTTQHDNPLYEPSSAPGSPGSVISIAFTFADTASLHSEGIVHRDIAARNLIITTEEGVYESVVGESIVFENDGPEDLRGVGSVRWMAPESIRTRTYNAAVVAGGAAQVGYWELSAGSFFDVSYPVPEPSTLTLMALAGLSCCIRSRRIMS